MSTETSILLPAATVDLFLKDSATIEAARRLELDWRFARVKIRIEEGDVETAIRVYGQSQSPEIILIETDTTDPSFVGRLGELSGSCNASTSAIVVGPVNDVNLYRSLTAMGVSDYLVFPVPVETLSEVIAASLLEKLGTSGSRLIAVAGAKGGVGTTALASALAFGCSEALGQKTLLLDAAGAWSSLGVGLGFEPTASTAEAIKAAIARDNDSLRRMMHPAGDRLSVLATGLEPMLDMPAQIGQFEEILNAAMAAFPVVIADLSGASSPSVRKTILARAHQTLVVATPTLSSLRSARALMQEIRKSHGGNAGMLDLVINMAGIAPGREVAKADIKAALEQEPGAVVPFDPKLFIGAENDAARLSADKAGAEIVARLLPLIEKTVGKDGGATEASTPSGIGGLLNRFRKK